MFFLYFFRSSPLHVDYMNEGKILLQIHTKVSCRNYFSTWFNQNETRSQNGKRFEGNVFIFIVFHELTD